MKDILAPTAFENVQLTVSLVLVDIPTECVLVLQVGWEIIVPKVCISIINKYFT